MSYPRILIDIKKLQENVEHLVKICTKQGIEVAGVTKGFSAYEPVVESFIRGGVRYLADSRIKNLKRLKDYKLPKIMLRLPMLSEVDDIVQYSDYSLNSELKTIKALSHAAIKKDKIHKIILMIDLGDLREGYFYDEELFKDIEEILKLKGIKLAGIGTNLTCYGGVIPEEDTLKKLIDYKNTIESKFNIELDIISGGNSSTIHLLDHKIPKGINQLRLGEVLLLGKETAYGNKVKGTYSDAFTLEVQVIEVKEKPSIPIGKIGMDAFGNKPSFVDRGIRKRILCGIGKQDIKITSIIPKDQDLIILGGSSDHLILDASDSEIEYKTGDIIKFDLKYGGILSAMTSEYVDKVIIN